MRVLVIEDDVDIRDAVTERLRQGGCAVDGAPDLSRADEQLSINEYDVVIADRSLPDGDSLALISDMRDAGDDVPVLFLTARDSVEDRIEGFEVGGDDYLVKPFAMGELVVRVRALGRRRATTSVSVLREGDIEIDRSRAEVRRDGVLLPLTVKEGCILFRLASSPGTAVSRTDLIEHCWDDHHAPMSNVVDAHIKSLRRKVGTPNPIRTVRGVGFVFELEPTA